MKSAISRGGGFEPARRPLANRRSSPRGRRRGVIVFNSLFECPTMRHLPRSAPERPTDRPMQFEGDDPSGKLKRIEDDVHSKRSNVSRCRARYWLEALRPRVCAYSTFWRSFNDS